MIPFQRAVLPNGLRLLHYRDVNTPMVVLNLLYDVGARDEHPQRTGLAHLCEHLMFAGSQHAPNYDGILQKAGGVSNAFTTADTTVYYDVVPAQNVETAFFLESDRLGFPALTDEAVATQKSVVIEEFKQRHLNMPYGDISHLLHALAYKVHPYRWPVIGMNLNHIEQTVTNDVVQFQRRHYAVNRLVLCVAGNITWERTFELTCK